MGNTWKVNRGADTDRSWFMKATSGRNEVGPRQLGDRSSTGWWLQLSLGPKHTQNIVCRGQVRMPEPASKKPATYLRRANRVPQCKNKCRNDLGSLVEGCLNFFETTSSPYLLNRARARVLPFWCTTTRRRSTAVL